MKFREKEMKTYYLSRGLAMSRKQSNFGSGTAKPKNFPAREDVLVTRIGEGVISGSAITDATKWFNY